MTDLELVLLAVAEAHASIADGGGPFGAIVTRAGIVVGRGRNRVVPDADPTAHAEVGAIRSACRTLGTHILSGATLVSSCEPCPMCLAAAWWARVDRIVYAATREDAKAAGFDDGRFYAELARPLELRSVPMVQVGRAAAREAFAAWLATEGRRSY